MLDIIKSYISNEKFYIIIMGSAIYIKNYSKIINIADDEIIIEISGTLYIKQRAGQKRLHQREKSRQEEKNKVQERKEEINGTESNPDRSQKTGLLL